MIGCTKTTPLRLQIVFFCTIWFYKIGPLDIWYATSPRSKMVESFFWVRGTMSDFGKPIWMFRYAVWMFRGTYSGVWFFEIAPWHISRVSSHMDIVRGPQSASKGAPKTPPWSWNRFLIQNKVPRRWILLLKRFQGISTTPPWSWRRFLNQETAPRSLENAHKALPRRSMSFLDLRRSLKLLPCECRFQICRFSCYGICACKAPLPCEAP